MALRLGLATAIAFATAGTVWFLVAANGSSSRALSFETAAPRYWPVIYDLRFNGSNPFPGGLESVWWTGDAGYGSGSTISASIPSPHPRDRIDIEARWIEWATGRLWYAQ